MASLYEQYRAKLPSSPIFDLERDAGRAAIDAQAAQQQTQLAAAASNARTAYARGVASRQRKLFRPRTSGIGDAAKLNAANISATSAAAKNASDLGLLANRFAPAGGGGNMGTHSELGPVVGQVYA